ncbi:MAG: hypothetical protein HZR80_21145 [Candidatus Heimdallarchaeota archaeon]
MPMQMFCSTCEDLKDVCGIIRLDRVHVLITFECGHFKIEHDVDKTISDDGLFLTDFVKEAISEDLEPLPIKED